MFLSRFFWKIYATCALLVVLTAAVVGSLALGQLQSALLREKESSLRQQCLRLEPQVREDLARGEASAEEWKGLVGETSLRLTLIRADGEVLFDSRKNPRDMENHLDREEVQEAFATGWGQSVRQSETLERRLFYVARAVGDDVDEPDGVVRLALEVEDIDREAAAMRTRLLLAASFGILAAMGLGAFVARRITLPLGELRKVAEDLRDGRYERRTGPLPRDEMGVLGDTLNQLGVEITRRLQELSGEEARLRAMLAGMVEGVVAVDEDDDVVFSNRAARLLLGVDDLSGRIWESVRIPELDLLVDEARSSDEAARRELQFGDPNGRVQHVQAQAHRFRADGRVGVVLVLHDQTELRRLERVRRDFVANVSHELKTPLTSIRGYVETLLSGALHDEDNNVRFLEKIDSNVSRLTHLVADLLSLARIESAEHGLCLEPIELRQMLTTALRQHEPRATEKGITCQVEAPAGSVRVLGDRESLLQVIDNLLSNAIKYTSEGEVVLALRGDDTHGILEVRDTGIGIPSEDLERVFERFYRVDKARSRELGGTGLGLSIVKHLVAAMDGEVGVESELERGTTFRVRLPLVEPQA